MEEEVREAFAKALQNQEGMEYPRTIQARWLDTPIGSLLAVGDQDSLYLLSFIQKSSMVRKAALLQRQLNARLEMGESASVLSIAGELEDYFSGRRSSFETPLHFGGTVFQVRVWEELQSVPFGHTISYTELAERIGKPSSFRAVAQANAQNPLTIVVPCHRVINVDGSLGGYSAGAERKRWLLEFEQKILAERVEQA